MKENERILIQKAENISENTFTAIVSPIVCILQKGVGTLPTVTPAL